MKVKTVTNSQGEVYFLVTDVLRLLQEDLIKKLKKRVTTEDVEDLIYSFEQLGKEGS